MPHVSNKMECLHACAARALGYETLHSMHRIDRWTTGLVSFDPASTYIEIDYHQHERIDKWIQ